MVANQELNKLPKKVKRAIIRASYSGERTKIPVAFRAITDSIFEKHAGVKLQNWILPLDYISEDFFNKKEVVH